MSDVGFRSRLVSPLAGVLFFVFAFGLVSCGSSDESTKNRRVATRPIEEVKADNTERLMSIPGVLGVLSGDIAGKPCLRILVQRRTMATTKDIPHSIEGYPVVIEEGRSFRTR